MVLGSITTNKASGDDGIPVELFQILKDDAVKVLHSICQKFGNFHEFPHISIIPSVGSFTLTKIGNI